MKACCGFVLWTLFVFIASMACAVEGGKDPLDVAKLRGVAPSAAAAAASAATVVHLQSPLTTVIPLTGAIHSGSCWLKAIIIAPATIPADVGIGGFVADRHGRWFQCASPNLLQPGTNTIEIKIDEQSLMRGEPHRAVWDAVAHGQVTQAGFFIWSTHPIAEPLTVIALSQELITDTAVQAITSPYKLRDLHYNNQDEHGHIHINTGARWSLSLTPTPFPINPYDPNLFKLDAIFTSPTGEEKRIPGFALEPTTLIDRGDVQFGQPHGPSYFSVRWRPGLPGQWRGRLEATWNNQTTITIDMPSIHVHGTAWDDYVRNDPDDVRFFRVDSKWYWPIGVNLHSTFDQRSRKRLGTILTPERGSEAYAAQFRRLAAAGGNATEIWMSSWNLALEWNADWPGYGGMGRYNQFNAAKMDQVLDDAYANGIRINLVINNHGQASPSNDREWKDNPWNKENGGPFDEPYQLFHDERAYVGQAQLRRYLVARYADHPAVLGWKLYSEINLTAMGDRQRSGVSGGNTAIASYQERIDTRRLWHVRAAAHMHEIDAYGHGVTTHWSGDYRKPYPEICELPGIDYICIDAYHSGGRSASRNNTLIDLIYNGTLEPNRGLGKFNKPVWVTEFGGTSQGGSSPELIAELASAGWAAMASGNVGMPMLWWFEWIDQGNRWQPFGAVQRFIQGEDFRGKEARGAVLAGDSTAGALWVRAWARPGRMLGYVADHQWAADGTTQPRHDAASITVGSQVSAGSCCIEWWDADHGQQRQLQNFMHPGGPLVLQVPAFVRHCAFKLTRATQAESE